MKPNPPIKGHRLRSEGHIHTEYDEADLTDTPIFIGGCLCGARPPGFPDVTIGAMKRWHREHKAELRGEQ